MTEAESRNTTAHYVTRYTAPFVLNHPHSASKDVYLIGNLQRV